MRASGILERPVVAERRQVGVWATSNQGSACLRYRESMAPGDRCGCNKQMISHPPEPTTLCDESGWQSSVTCRRGASACWGGRWARSRVRPHPRPFSRGEKGAGSHAARADDGGWAIARYHWFLNQWRSQEATHCASSPAIASRGCAASDRDPRAPAARVPAGRPIIAQRFIAGSNARECRASPVGTTE